MSSIEKIIKEYTKNYSSGSSDGQVVSTQILFKEIIPLIKLGLVDKEELIKAIAEENEKKLRNSFDFYMEQFKLSSENKDSNWLQQRQDVIG